MKIDEAWLLKELYKEHLKKPIDEKLEDILTFENFFKPLGYKTPKEIIEGQKLYNNKRLWYVLSKFDDKGYVEVGTSLGSAWLTDEGIEKVLNIIASEKGNV